ncbi:MAG: guanylate kinase [Myxococcota bacterium]
MRLQGWQAPDTGALFVVSGASGTGKTTLLRAALERVPGLEFSVSATTRAPRAGERDGVDYHYVSVDRFREMREGGALLEHAEVYGTLYGTPRAPVEQALKEGRSIVLDIDVQGAGQVRAAFPAAVTIFILPPEIGTIRERLAARGTDGPEVVERRIRDAHAQIARCGEYDYLVMNDVLDTAHAQLQGILLAELSRRSRRDTWVRAFVPGAGA